jgi:rod shape-determining protein MreD
MIRAISDRKINRAPSPLLLTLTPWVMVMIGSLAPLLPLVASAPIMPPLGFLFVTGWMQHRPGIFPAWAGFPLGLFDDLFSGQPFGSAALLWSVAVLGLEILEAWLPYRNFFLNWLISAGLVVGYLVLGAVFAGSVKGLDILRIIAPQIMLSILLVPLTGRLIALFDRFRLIPIRNVG